MLMQASRENASTPPMLDGFRQAMRQLASGVALVTCEHHGEWRGMAATSLTSLSFDPPSLLVCINRNSRFHPSIAIGKHFGVNLLNKDQAELSNKFGCSKSALERFKADAWFANEAGVPLLEDALAAIDCLVDEIVDYGTHSIIIGRVSEVCLGTLHAPLIYFDGQYH